MILGPGEWGNYILEAIGMNVNVTDFLELLIENHNEADAINEALEGLLAEVKKETYSNVAEFAEGFYTIYSNAVLAAKR